MQVRVGSPQGTVVGEIKNAGTITLGNWVQNGDQFYLVGKATEGASSVLLGSTRIVIRNECLTSATISASAVLDGASFTRAVLTPSSIGSVFGANLSRSSMAASEGLPTSLNGVSLRICGTNPKLFYVSPTQINFLMPRECQPGRHQLSLNGQFIQDVPVIESSPTLFVINGGEIGVPLGFATIVDSAGKKDVPLFACAGEPVACAPTKLDLRSATELYLVLYATGMGNAARERVVATLGNEGGEVLFSGAHPDYPGLDQVNVRFRQEQFRQGIAFLRITSNGLTSNGAVIDMAVQ